MAKKNFLLAGIVSIALFFVPLLFLGRDVIDTLTDEDGFFEYLTALFFFFAAVLFFYLFLKAKNRSLFFLLFALAFLFAAGEEISWGQRIFHFSTPPAIEAASAQKEFNFHNLTVIQHEKGFSGTLKSFLNFNRFFILFWMAYTVLVPLADRYSAWFRTLFAKIRLPIAPLWFGLLFFINEVTSKAVELQIVARFNDNLDSPEIKEAMWAVLIFMIGIYFTALLLHPEKARAARVSHAPL